MPAEGRNPDVDRSSHDSEGWELYIRATSGSSTAAAREAYHRWRDSSPAARSEASRIESLDADLALLATDFAAAPDPVSAPRRRRAWAWPAAVAASLLLAVLYGAAALDGRWQAVVASLRYDIASGIGERRAIDLSDGSRASLDAASAVDIDFSAARRVATLARGRALFSVAGDPSRPFVVTAGEVTITVLGTAFSVEIDPDGAKTVSVASGRVSVGVPGMASHDLQPGDRLRTGPEPGTVRVDQISPDDVAPWLDGWLVIDDLPLSEAVELIGRHRAGSVWILHEDLAKRRISAVLNLDEGGVDAAFDRLLDSFDIVGRRIPGGLILVDGG